MRRRTWAGLLAVVLVVGMAVLAATEPVPYVTFGPGPTVNVLGKYKKDDIITVSGHKAYQDDGGLHLTTVVPSGPDEKISIPQLVSAWVDPDRDVYPYRAIYPPTATQKSVREESSAQMVSSKDSCGRRGPAGPGHPLQDRGEDLGRHQGRSGRRQAEGRRPGALR